MYTSRQFLHYTQRGHNWLARGQHSYFMPDAGIIDLCWDETQERPSQEEEERFSRVPGHHEPSTETISHAISSSSKVARTLPKDALSQSSVHASGAASTSANDAKSVDLLKATGELSEEQKGILRSVMEVRKIRTAHLSPKGGDLCHEMEYSFCESC